jgi:ACS family tartrate transporter-like MFS transporter
VPGRSLSRLPASGRRCSRCRKTMSNSHAGRAQAELVGTAVPPSDVAQRARHRSARHLLPYLLVLYVIAFLDRMNIGAAALQMPHDLGFSPATIGFGAGIFFCGYFLLGFPGALIAERWSARKLMGYIMIGWGVVTVFMAFIQTATQFYIVRFLVGATESGFFPGAIVYMSHWFRYEDRAKAVAAFYAANPLSYVIGSPLAGVLLGLSWLGLRGWRWLFILEGIPAVLFGIITLFYLTDWPHEAKWLREDEREWITEQLRREKEAKKRVRSCSIWDAIRHRDVMVLTLCYLCAMTGSYGIGFWFPTIVKRVSGLSDLKVTLIGALPYVAAIVVQQANGWHSDSTRERRWHAAMPVFLCGCGLALAVLFRSNPVISIALLVLAGGAFYGFQPVFWAVPTIFLGESAAAASIGLINSVGNLGGFVGPIIMGFLATRLHSFSAGLLYLVGNLFMAGVLILMVGAQSQHSTTTG